MSEYDLLLKCLELAEKAGDDALVFELSVRIESWQPAQEMELITHDDCFVKVNASNN